MQPQESREQQVEPAHKNREQEEVVEVHEQQVTSEPPSPPSSEPSPSPTPKAILVKDDALCLQIQSLSDEVIRNFQEAVTDITTFQTTLVQDMQHHQQQKDHAVVKCLQIQRQMHDLEAEQTTLAEKEEFELADKLSGQLEILQQEYSQHLETDKASMQAYEEAETSLAECRRELSLKMKETSHGLRNLIRQQTEELSGLMSGNESALKTEDSRVAVEEERISMELAHVAREESTLNEETTVIEQAILAQTKAVQEDKIDMDRDLLGVTCEIERLEAELRGKKQEKKMLEMNIEVAEGKIKVVRRKYDRQLQRISDRSMTIRAASEECRDDSEAIQSQRELVVREQNKLDSIERAVTKGIASMENERELVGKLKETFDAVLLKSSVSVIKGDVGGDTGILREKVVSQETALERAISDLDISRSSLQALAEEDSDLKEKIPMMEGDKKSHASNKRFKEAASVAKEIKGMAARREDISGLVSALENQVRRILLQHVHTVFHLTFMFACTR